LHFSEAIYDKLVLSPRGGWCHEKNALLCWALRELGFRDVRMLNGQSFNGDELRNPFDHMALMVVLEDGQKILADVGWGGSNASLLQSH